MPESDALRAVACAWSRPDFPTFDLSHAKPAARSSPVEMSCASRALRGLDTRAPQAHIEVAGGDEQLVRSLSDEICCAVA